MFHFTFRKLVAALLVALLAGCQPPLGTQAPVQQGPPPPPPPPGTPAPSAIQAKDATGVWSQSQVEQFLKEELALTTISLRSTGNNGYQGTATDVEGIAYTLTVKQVPGGIKVDWTHSTGKGTITFGNPVP